MSGALHRSLARGWAGGGRARRYAGGGGVDDPDMDILYPAAALLRAPAPLPDADQGGAPPQDNYRSMPPPALPPAGAAAVGRARPPAPQGALARANPPDTEAPPPEGALGRNAPPSGGGGSPDQQDPDAQRKMFDMNRAMMILRSSSGTMPMMAAAGAMLSPTRTGGFSESLGNAFTAYAKTGAQERATDEQMAERLLQAQWQNDYRQQMAAAATSRAATYQDVGQARIPLMQAQSGMDMARAAYLTARAAAGAAAHVTPGDLQATAMNSLLTPASDGTLPINPDTGKPWQKIEAFQATQAATAAGQGVAERGGVAAAHMVQNQPLVDAKVNALQETQQFHESVQQMKQAGVPFAQALAVGKLAAQIMAAKPGTTWDQAMAQASEGLPSAAGRPTGAAAPAPAPARPGAPAVATPTTPAVPKPQRPPPPPAFPNAQWSDKYGAYLIPGDGPGKWKVVGGGQASQ
jgi:hypothetical protein